jgi:NAD+ synthase
MKQTVSAADALSIDTDVVTEILVGFIRDEVGKVGFDRVVLGLSGGVDSALVAALAVRALGPERVVPVLMPYRSSSPESEADARTVSTQLGLEPLVVDISPQVDAYFERFPDADRGRRGNKMARERMSILYDMSWAHRALVIGTSNKTELLLGYGTIFGDMASALNPVGDLYKTQVFAMARALDLPQRVVEKAPSADLWEGQSDEQELGFQYAVVDTLLYHLVDERRARAELRNLGFDDAFVDQVSRRLRDNQYKRRLPIIAKLSTRTIDRDFRYPRDWGR